MTFYFHFCSFNCILVSKALHKQSKNVICKYFITLYRQNIWRRPM